MMTKMIAIPLSPSISDLYLVYDVYGY